jgi:flagellin-like protein
MLRTPPRRAMHPRKSLRGGRRGLAEIVGTLMLVLIVVAAAVTFSFYVASTEQAELAERNALHLKNLENVTIQSIDFVPGQNVTLILSSSDIYNTSLTDISVNGNPAQSYCVEPGNATTQCNLPASYVLFPVAGGSDYLTLVPFSVTAVTLADSGFYLQPFSLGTASISIDFGTTRGNEFVYSLLPPVGRIGTEFSDGYPILDGSASFQPHGGSFPNATIEAWNWNLTPTNAAGTASNEGSGYTGEQVELPNQFVAGANFTFMLTVTNTLGLSSTTSQNFTAPG